MKQILLLAGLLLLLAVPVSAQTGALVSVTANVCPQGSIVGCQLSTVLVTPATQCNLTPPVGYPGSSTLVTNPTQFAFDDPVNGGKVCLVSASSFLAALPVIAGNYVATMTVLNDFGFASGVSVTSNPFKRAVVSGPPPVPTNPRVF